MQTKGQDRVEPRPYTWEELKLKWEKEKLTNEQLLGQLVIWGQLTHTLVVTCQHQLESRQRQMDELLARVAEVEHRLAVKV